MSVYTEKVMTTALDIFASKQSNKILTDTLSAIERQVNGDQKIYAGVIFTDPYKVIITKDEMGMKEETNIRSMAGAEVDYIVTDIEPELGIAVASRKKAMEMRRKNDLPNKTPGDIVVARVIVVNKDSLIVETHGIETQVFKENAVWGYVRDLREMFSPGDKVHAVIKDIDLENSTIEISIKENEENPFDRAIGKYKTGGEYLGTVTGVEDYGIFVELERGVSALCRHPAWENISVAPNDKVLIRLYRINPEKKKMAGVLTRFVKKGY